MPALLDVSHLSIHFGGVKAVQEVSFSIDPGIVYSVIGPNGAGKTTLFNLITGVYKPTAGEIRLDGEAIGGKSPDELARRGVARTFQNLQICMNMSAIENVMVGAHLRLDRNLIKAALRFPGLTRRDAELREEAAGLMRFVGLDKYIEARGKCGQSVDISFDAVRDALKKQVRTIKSTYNCESVKFRVVVEDGKAKVKAVPQGAG